MVNLDNYKPLSTTRMSDGRRRLNRKLILTVKDTVYVIPEGFVTDFSSYPWFTRLLVRFDRVDVAGVLHDYLYYYANETRLDSDQIWRVVAMTGNHGANPFQAWISWAGLRLFGWFPWSQHRKRERAIY